MKRASTFGSDRLVPEATCLSFFRQGYGRGLPLARARSSSAQPKREAALALSLSLCKIPLYNPDSQSNLDEINPQSTQLTQFTLYATRQLSSLAWASLEPMPFGIVASIDAS